MTLSELKSTINLQWLRGQKEAKEAATNNLNLERQSISLEAASTVIKRFLKDPQPELELIRQVYSQLSDS